jgi:hypothetical protein
MTSNVTMILQQIEHGVPAAAGELLPLVYEELRKLAAARLAAENAQSTFSLASIWFGKSISTRESSLSTAYQTLLSCLMRRQC